jgi:hypothetical protein
MYQVNGSRVEWDPSPARLREPAGKMPNASATDFGNVNVKARVDSRGTRSAYLVEDSTNSRGQTITRTECERVAALQDAYIATSSMAVVDGFTGSDPTFCARARLIMKAAYDVAAAVPGADDIEIRQPRRRYGRQGQVGQHAAMAARLKRERKHFLGSFPGLDESLVKSLG